MAKDDDPQLNAARYIVDREAAKRGEQTPTEAARERDPQRSRTTAPTPADRAMYVETVLQQAIRRGDFDDLPGAGKPLTGLTAVHDPDWWIRRKIEREQLTGLGPPALTLRVENAALDDRLDALAREDDVRAVLEDFNLRVVEARRQLLGGPPVVTPTRDVDAEVVRWRERRRKPR
ncbi:MAG TPA: DUF1992 domain-containing protein [Pseudolysinimonas sp.]|nr:DUF1992 domain-containing protein [Pseudolysinimonas sp.]